MSGIETRQLVRCDAPGCRAEWTGRLPNHQGGILAVLHRLRGWGAVTVHRPRATSRERMEGPADPLVVLCPDHARAVRAAIAGPGVAGPPPAITEAGKVPGPPALSWRRDRRALSTVAPTQASDGT